MGKIGLAPYIFFKGECREAFAFYKNIFGGELEEMEYKDMQQAPPEMAELEGKLMNASLLGGIVELRGSDTLGASPTTKKIELCLSGDDEAKLREIFDALAQGGEAKAPLKKEFWGDIFGQVTDKYGVDWMVNITPTKS